MTRFSSEHEVALPVGRRGRQADPRRRFGPAVGLCALLVLSLLAAGCTLSNGDEDARATAGDGALAHRPEAKRFVGPDGRDDWPGTRERPWRTLHRALEAVYRGQVLYIRGGVYREDLSRLQLHRGGKYRPILVRNFPGERPVLKGSIALRRPMYWQIRGLNVTANPHATSVPPALVKVIGGVGWSWTKSEIWGSRGSANVLVVGDGVQEPESWTLTQNCLHDVKPAAGVTRSSNLALADMAAAGPGLVSRNLIFGERAEFQVALGSAKGGGPTDVKVLNNTMYGGDVSVSIAGDASFMRVERNIMTGTTSEVLVRWNARRGRSNEVLQNIGSGALVFMRPAAEARIGGAGNVLDPTLSFIGEQDCDGFRTTNSAALPYGRYGIG